MRNFRAPTTSVFSLAILLFIGTCLSACGGSDTDQSSDFRSLNRGINGDPESLDIHRFSGTDSGKVLRDLGEGLTAYTADGKLIPGAAERWEVSTDGLDYTFYLRPEARWSNGDPVLAGHFVSAYRRLVTPSTASSSGKFLAMVKNASAITAGDVEPGELAVQSLDDYTLKITLETPTPYFLQLLTHPSTFPIHVPSLEAHGDQHARAGNLVSNGPYQLHSWNISSNLVLNRNPHYWNNDQTFFDDVTYHVLALSTELTRYRAGDLDVTASVPEEYFLKMKEERPDELKVSPALGVYYYGFNLTKPWLKNNVQLRKALSMAIDREAIVSKITRRGEEAAYGLVPPGIDNYTAQSLDYSDLSREDRLEEARRLYAEAGYGPDNPLEIELRYNTMGGHGTIAVAIQAMWLEALGVEAELINEEFKVMLSNIQSMQITEVFRLSWSGDYNDAQTFLQLAETNNPQNLTAYSNPLVDNLLKQAANEVDLDIRRGYLEDAEQMFLDDHAIIPVYYYVTKHMVATDIQGWESMPLDYHYTRHLSRSDAGGE